MTPCRMDQLLAKFPELRVAVVGDFFLDKYLVIEKALKAVSRETGIPSHQVVGKRRSPGAAGSVAKALTALDVGTVYAIGAIGDDGDGYDLDNGLIAERVDTTYLLRKPELMTPTYVKPMVRDENGVETEINRFDIWTRDPTSTDLEDAILASVEQVLPELDAVIMIDQMEERETGVITDRVRDELCNLAAANPDTIFYADSRLHIGMFRDVIIKPNKLEAAMACGEDDEEHELTAGDAMRCGSELMTRGFRAAFVTAGPEGMIVFDQDGATHIPAFEVPPPTDICGAGDSTTAGTISALCAGATYTEAGVTGNCVASITVQQIGTTGRATREQVSQRFAEYHPQFSDI